ncbi:MAG: DUF4166 domain-containing protein [Crocinitomicaceae bacterium]
MGESKDKLAQLFELIHGGNKEVHLKGTFQSERGIGPVNYFFWLFMAIPKSKEKSGFTLEIIPNNGKIQWRRKFAKKRFWTQTKMENGLFIERKGLIQFEFEIKQIEEGWTYNFKRLKFLRIDIPSWLSVKPTAVNKVISETKWEFEVKTTSPFGSQILKYWGTAEIQNREE